MGDGETKVLRAGDRTTVDAYARDDASATTIDGCPLPGRAVAAVLRSLPDWSIGDATREDWEVAIAPMRATYSADVSRDGIWSALADSADLSVADLALDCA